LEPVLGVQTLMYLTSKPAPVNIEELVDWQPPNQAGQAIDILDSEWQPPVRFKEPTEQSVFSYWVEMIGRQHPVLTRWYVKQQIPLILAKFEFLDVMRVIAWVSSPRSKFYQFPCTLKSTIIEKALEEMQSGEQRVYTGFLGPLNLKDLSKERK